MSHIYRSNCSAILICSPELHTHAPVEDERFEERERFRTVGLARLAEVREFRGIDACEADVDCGVGFYFRGRLFGGVRWRRVW